MRSRIRILLALSLIFFVTDCSDEGGVVDLVTGSVSGTVTADGSGLSGVTVTASGVHVGTATTGSDGSYQIDDLPVGPYTVSISGYPPDVGFPATSKNVTLPSTGETVTVNFAGTAVSPDGGA